MAMEGGGLVCSSPRSTDFEGLYVSCPNNFEAGDIGQGTCWKVLTSTYGQTERSHRLGNSRRQVKKIRDTAETCCVP